MPKLELENSDNLEVTSLDEKIAEVKCKLCGRVDTLPRTEIRKLNRNGINVVCECEADYYGKKE